MLRFLLLLAFSFNVLAENWANWRGPNWNGSIDAKDLPVKFSPTEKVKWKADLGGNGASTPIIVGKFLFTTAANADKGQLLAICIERSTGKIIWSKDAGSGYQPNGDGTKAALGSRSNYASPSPISDGKTAIFFFGNGDLVAYNVKGNEKWRRNIQKEEGDFTFQWTFSSSPVLLNGKVYLAVLQRDEIVHGRGKDGNESFILCFDLESGNKDWKVIRKSPAQKESLESFGTIIPSVINGKTQLVIAGGDILTGHEPETGKELWRWGTWNKNHREKFWRLVTSPTQGPDNIFLVCAPSKEPVYAVQIDKYNKPSLLWKSAERSNVTSDVPTPLYYMNYYFVLSDVRKKLSKVNPKTGEVLWEIDTPGLSKYRGSPLGADGKLYFMNHGGEVVVIDANDGKMLAKANAMAGDDDTHARASIISDGEKIYVRTETKIFCIGN